MNKKKIIISKIFFPGNSGSVELDLGKTKVFTKIMLKIFFFNYFIFYLLQISGEIVEPRQDRPTEGFLKFTIDLSLTNDST